MYRFSATDWKNRKFNSKKLNGKITFINFWFEACRPCIAEFELLNNLYKQYKDHEDFQFLSFIYESKENVERIVSQYVLAFPIISMSSKEIYKLNYKLGFPLNIILDKKVRIGFISPGGPITKKEAQQKFDAVIKPEIERLYFANKLITQ